MISSQEFRNQYEKFYNSMREYLWSYPVVEQLAEVEVDIYSAFIDRDKLRNDFNKLVSDIDRDILDDDTDLQKSIDNIRELIDSEDEDSYLTISRVQEVRPDENKQIKQVTKEDTDQDEFEETTERSYQGL